MKLYISRDSSTPIKKGRVQPVETSIPGIADSFLGGNLEDKLSQLEQRLLKKISFLEKASYHEYQELNTRIIQVEEKMLETADSMMRSYIALSTVQMQSHRIEESESDENDILQKRIEKIEISLGIESDFYGDSKHKSTRIEDMFDQLQLFSEKIRHIETSIKLLVDELDGGLRNFIKPNMGATSPTSHEYFAHNDSITSMQRPWTAPKLRSDAYAIDSSLRAAYNGTRKQPQSKVHVGKKRQRQFWEEKHAVKLASLAAEVATLKETARKQLGEISYKLGWQDMKIDNLLDSARFHEAVNMKDVDIFQHTESDIELPTTAELVELNLNASSKNDETLMEELSSIFGVKKIDDVPQNLSFAVDGRPKDQGGVDIKLNDLHSDGELVTQLVDPSSLVNRSVTGKGISIINTVTILKIQ